MRLLDNKKLRNILILLIIVLINIVVFNVANFDIKGGLTLQYDIKADTPDSYQMFYTNGENWSEEDSSRIEYTDANQEQVIKYNLPEDISMVRIDLGEQVGKVELSNISINHLWSKLNLESVILGAEYSGISEIIEQNQKLIVDRITNDAFIVIDLDDLDINRLFDINVMFNYIFKIVICIITTAVLLLVLKKGSGIKKLGRELYSNKTLIWNLSKNDFKTKYAGSYLGVIWAFVQPIVTVLVYWFVFQVGFKTAPIEDFPYVLWLICGLVPWFFFSDSILNSTNSMLEYSYLVKKVVFKISILPIIKIISALFVHLFFIVFTLVLFMGYGYKLDIYTLQVIYYTVCTFVLVLALSYATCSIVIFFRDFGQIINILLQIGVWMTPIMWPYTMISEGYRWILKVNPMYYIVEGYRDSLINKVWFWERFNQTIYFWVLTSAIFVIGTVIFKRLKVHFADVL